jgi:hypothetical protein
MMIRLGTAIESVSPTRGGVPECSQRSAGQLPVFRSLNEEFGWAPKGIVLTTRLKAPTSHDGCVLRSGGQTTDSAVRVGQEVVEGARRLPQTICEPWREGPLSYTPGRRRAISWFPTVNPCKRKPLKKAAHARWANARAKHKPP